MTLRKTLTFGAIAVAAVALSGCVDGYYGGGYGYGGVATGFYAGPVGYGGDYYSGYGYPAYGWYNDYYYPGYGSLVFGRYGERRGWNDVERGHWGYRGAGGERGEWRGNHLYANRGFDARRDQAYMADRATAFRNYRQNGPQRGQPLGGQRHDGDHRRP